MPLAVIQGAGDQGHVPIRFKADAAHLPAGRPGQLEIVADAPAAQFAARAALLFARGKADPVGEPQRVVQQVGEVAAVIGRPVRRPVRHRLGRDVVLAAQLDRVDAQLPGGGLDQSFHIVIGFGPPGAAISPDRGCVGEDAFGRDLDQRCLVNAERVPDRIAGRRAGGTVGSAQIAVAVEPHGEETAVAVERELGRHLGVAPMGVGDKAARTVVGPFDRAAEFARGIEDAIIFRVGRLLHAERAADPFGQDAHLVAPDAENAGDVVAKPEDALAADMQGPVLARGVVIGDRRARLHRIDDDAVVAQPELCHVSCRGKGGGDLLAVAEMKIEPDILRHVIVEDRRVGGVGEGGLGDRRQRVDVDGDEFGGVPGLRRGLGDDRGDRLADMPYLIRRERVMGRHQHRGAVAVVHDLAGRQRADAALRQLGRGVDCEHTGHLPRRRGVDAADDAVGDVASHHDGIGLAGKVDVVRIMALAAQQHRVFRARHRLADREFLLGPEQGRIDVVVHWLTSLRMRPGFLSGYS